MPRPFKVWSANRENKKSVTAESLAELVRKGREKLDIPQNEPVRLVLNEDGTEVDEEDYFTFLPNNATVMILKSTEKWHPVGLEVTSQDEVDTMQNPVAMSDRVKQLISHLQRDVSQIITFSNDDLQSVVDTPIVDLAPILHDTENYARAMQESCLRHLEERQQASEAMDLLRLYHKARQHSLYMDTGKKRRVDDNTP